MLRIRKITDVRSPSGRAAVEAVQAIIRAEFSGIPAEDIDKLPDKLHIPFRYQFVSELFVAEDGNGRIKAAALLLFDPDDAFAYLEVMSTAPSTRPGTGIGGTLYERVREEAAELGARGLYLECLPDDPETSPDPEIRKQNAARLKLYERYGAVPIVGIDYQLPIREGDTDMPFLVFDGLDRYGLPDARGLRHIVRAILERKYAAVCPPAYVERVVGSIREGGYALRARRYVKREPAVQPVDPGRIAPIPLIVNDRHMIHDMSRDRGYVEAPVRVRAILKELDRTPYFKRSPARHYPERHIRAVHEPALVDYIRRACAEAPEKSSVYPYVFPIRNAARRPRERSVLAGYWCIDTFTPLNRNAWPAARHAVDCTLTAADALIDGAPAAYALVRPPGHHAERRAFGGFCYFCNGAIAAQHLSHYGTVAILDIDYHHGNGQQDIFYERDDVLTVSIHGAPSIAYPYFSGFRDEAGRGKGAGYNLNIPLPETITPEQFRDALKTALRRVERFEPSFLVLCLGFDTARGDPTGTWSNGAADFRKVGQMIGEAGWRTLIVQEGGYRVRTLGVNARNFFTGLVEGMGLALSRGPDFRRRAARRASLAGTTQWREAVRVGDAERVRDLVVETGFFSAEEVEIATELVAERISKGRGAGYEFVLAEKGGRLVGYTCWGLVPGTERSYDLYWIAVAPDTQGSGLGRELLRRTEAAVARRGGGGLYAETSSTPTYAPTRAFYERTGFKKAAEFPDFYRAGDGKVVYAKSIGA